MKSYAERSAHFNELGKQLFLLMEEKKTNLCLSIDLVESSEILELADKLGDYICLLKTHIDIIQDFSVEFVEKLTALAQKKKFYIFEDRKFADIGNTVKLQYKG
jgi:orotidine 5'-phosphate decarboxylase subfamily 1